MAASELAGLREELARCKADKEFVWSLWKQLQKDSPDITDAISLAVTREKTKQELAQQKLTATLKERDAEIETLQEELDNQGKTIAKLEIASAKLEAEQNQLENKHASENSRTMNQLNKATDEVSRLRSVVMERDNEIEQHLKAIEVLMRKAGGMESELKLSKTEIARLSAMNQRIQETMNEVQRNSKQIASKHMKEIEKLKNELKKKEQALGQQGKEWQREKQKNKVLKRELLSSGHEEWCECSMTNDQSDENEMDEVEEVTLLQLQVSKLSQEKKLLENKNNELYEIIEEKTREALENRRLMSLMEAGLQDGVRAEPDTQYQLLDLKELLTRTEKELFEVRGQVAAMEDELCCLKEKHDKRLERMRNLKESHELVLKQLKTYELSPSPLRGKKPAPPHLLPSKGHPKPSPPLRHEEDCCSAWNELTRYKNLYREIKQDKIAVEEELDSLQVECASCKSTIAELRVALQEERNASEARAAALQRMKEESVFMAGRMEEDRVEKLEMINEQLTTERNRVADENRKLSNECYQLRAESADLQQTILKLKHKAEAERRSRLVTQSTMTDCLPKADSATQVDAVSSQDSVETNIMGVWSSSSSQTVDTTKPSRRRHYSDGDLGFNKHHSTARTSREKLNHTVNVPLGTCTCGQKQATSCLPIKRQRSRSAQTFQTSVWGGAKSSGGVAIKKGLVEHKCVWQTKLKSSQQRVRTLTKQVTVLMITKRSLSEALEQSQSKVKRLEDEQRALKDRQTTSKTIIQNLRNELGGAESRCAELQGRCDALESMGLRALSDQQKRSQCEEENKKLGEEIKILNDKLSGTSAELKNVQTELKQKLSENEGLQQRVSNLERDLKQKRMLLTDQKKRMSKVEDQVSSDKEKMNCLNSQVESLQSSLEHFKQRVNSLKSQSEHHLKEKENVKLKLAKCQQELESVTQELSAAQSECKKKTQQLSLMKRAADKRSEETRREYQLAITDLQRRAEAAQLMVLEYREFLMDLAREIFFLQQCRQQEMSRKRVMGSSSKRRSDISQKARRIAQATFELSDVEVDELMSARDEGVSTAQKYSSSLSSKVSTLLNSDELHLPKQKLMSEFSSCVHSLISM